MKKSVKALSLILAFIMTFAIFTVGVNAEDAPAACEHEYGEWQVETEQTCETTGVSYRVCSKCDELTDGHKQTEEIPAHFYGDWIVDHAPTCTSSGVKYRVCAKCLKVENVVLNEKGHNYDETGTVVAPTCTTEGYTGYKCKNCKDIKKEDIVPALGHTYGDWTVTSAPTCTEAGSRERVCTVCDELTANHIQVETISALGHSYEETVVAPTYEAGGYTLHKCTVCGDEYKDSETEALPDKVASVLFRAQDSAEEANEGIVYVLNYGDTYTLDPIVKSMKNANVVNDPTFVKSVVYTSNNESIATVDENGLITATGSGALSTNPDKKTALITCTVTDAEGNEYTATCNIKVKFSIGDWLKIIIDVIRVAFEVVIGGIFKGILGDTTVPVE